jgi:hypothetical protein
MHLTHGNLRGLTLHLRPPAPVFAGEPATLEVVLDQPRRRTPWRGPAFDDRAARPAWPGATCRPRAGHAAERFTPAPAAAAVPTLLVETGFRWACSAPGRCGGPAGHRAGLAAARNPPPPLPPGQPSGGHELQARSGTAGGEFDGVRAWRRGDTLRQVVWKKVARTGELVSRDTSASAAQALVLDYAAAGALDSEARLSRLAAWVLAAERSGLGFGLRLPGQELPQASGEGQRRAALEALALCQPVGR